MGLGSGVAVGCGVGCRHSSDPALLWLWLAAVALIGPLTWESPYAAGVALKKQTNKKKTRGKTVTAKGKGTQRDARLQQLNI